jgi:hypothetical protein
MEQQRGRLNFMVESATWIGSLGLMVSCCQQGYSLPPETRISVRLAFAIRLRLSTLS